MEASTALQSSKRRAHRRRRLYGLAALVLLLAAAVAIAASTGSAAIPLSAVWRVLLSQLPGLAFAGTEPATTTPEEFAAYIREETKKWGDVIKAGNIKLQ